MNKNVPNLVFHKETGHVSEIIALNFVEEEVITTDKEENAINLKFEQVEFLDYVGYAEDKDVYFNHDVFKSTVSGALYELELVDNGRIQFHHLNGNLEREVSVDSYSIDKFMQILENSNTYELVGNLHELRFEAKEQTVDMNFNVKIVKPVDNDFHFYACNNKKDETIDLIKVIYIGSVLLEEETYQRTTIDYGTFTDLMKRSELVEVTPMELQKHVMNEMAKTSEFDEFDESDEYDCCDECDGSCGFAPDGEAVEPPNDYDDSDTDDESAEEVCERCELNDEDCECELY